MFLASFASGSKRSNVYVLVEFADWSLTPNTLTVSAK